MTNFTTEIMETLINKGDLDDLFRIQLFQKGITMSEISELIEKMYGHYSLLYATNHFQYHSNSI